MGDGSASIDTSPIFSNDTDVDKISREKSGLKKSSCYTFLSQVICRKKIEKVESTH